MWDNKTICISMIVRQEAHVIRRCLDSVLPIADGYAICDTGSTDDTQGIIRTHLANLPGIVVDRPWVDFATNRNQALDLARGLLINNKPPDYVLVIDADDRLVIDPGCAQAITCQAYAIEIHGIESNYPRIVLFQSNVHCYYKGILHEYIDVDTKTEVALLECAHLIYGGDGARSQNPKKYEQDAAVFEAALLEEPDNARYVHYLAQSYRDCRQWDKAIENYQRRAAMGGWEEEVWVALYQIARIKEFVKHPIQEVINAYRAAYRFAPNRIEPLYRLARIYYTNNDYISANKFLAHAITIPIPTKDKLYVEYTLYDYAVLLDLAATCSHIGNHAKAVELNNLLLNSTTLPPNILNMIRTNRSISMSALQSQLPGTPTSIFNTFRAMGIVQ